MAPMLGLVDFLRAVRGTVGVALRRVHPLAGAMAMGLVWVVALGSLLWVTRDDEGDPPSSSEVATSTQREGGGTRTADRDDGSGGADGSDGDGDAAGGNIGEAEWTD